MRKSQGSVILALSIAASVVALAPASAASVADASVTLTGAPERVSPPGGIALYRITVKNEGPSVAPVDLTDTTTGGSYVAASSKIPAGCAAPADGTANPTITCSFGTVLPGETREVSVAIDTPAVEGSVTNTATVAVPPNSLDVFDDNPANDEATVTTPVVFAADGSATLLQVGDSLPFKAHLLTLRSSERGVIALLRDAPANGDTCGTTPCGDGLHVGFDTDPDYQGQLGLLLDFGKGNPCRGIGSGANCADIYMRKNGVITLVPKCDTNPLASPCVESVNKSGPVIQWKIRLGSEDPDFVPPLNLSR